ncbi:MAG: PilX N-terminal domain-containing pilus assembly protein [Gammaproteobacteria bacterium]
MMRPLHRQRGATLFVALIFLLIMTLFAVSSVNLSTVNFKIVGNMQAMKHMEAAAQDAIEQMLSDANNYSAPADQTITSTVAGVDYTVDVSAPQCMDSQTASGYSAVIDNIIPQDNTWEFIANVTDPVTSATATVHQGVEIRMLAGNCPDP